VKEIESFLYFLSRCVECLQHKVAMNLWVPLGTTSSRSARCDFVAGIELLAPV